MKTAELIGVALDWAVAKCEHGDKLYLYKRDFLKISYKNGHPIPAINDPEGDQFAVFMQYSTDWAQGGPIIECEKISIWSTNTTHYPNDSSKWQAEKKHIGRHHNAGRNLEEGDTPLIAAMRCYVASKLGDEVEIPKELV